MFSLLDTAR